MASPLKQREALEGFVKRCKKLGNHREKKITGKTSRISDGILFSFSFSFFQLLNYQIRPFYKKLKNKNNLYL